MSTMPPHFTLQRRSEVVLHEHHIKGQEVLDVYERVSSFFCCVLGVQKAGQLVCYMLNPGEQNIKEK